MHKAGQKLLIMSMFASSCLQTNACGYKATSTYYFTNTKITLGTNTDHMFLTQCIRSFWFPTQLYCMWLMVAVIIYISGYTNLTVNLLSKGTYATNRRQITFNIKFCIKFFTYTFWGGVVVRGYM